LSQKPANVLNMNSILSAAERGGYAVGAFSPRYTAMIAPILQAGQALNSPLIVIIAEKEFEWYEITPRQFADEFFKQVRAQNITVPVALHLDHTSNFPFIQEAIAAGFTSVMIDASAKSFAENIAESKEVVDYAQPFGVSVEAELGRITTTDYVESDNDEELYTDPQEAGQFVRETGIDALAVSVGTAHGVYVVRQPTIDYDRLRAIRSETPVHLVLHGGSGVPAEMVKKAIRLPDGGVSKVNIATDLELAAFAALNRDTRMTSAAMDALPEADRLRAIAAVRQVVEDKIQHFLNSDGQAR
jgi:ketose-bisphosphate aldolase